MKFQPAKPKRSVYLDNAGATPMDPEAEAAMRPFFARVFGNPSSLHTQGRNAKQALEFFRKSVAGLISALPEEVVFTAGGTESCNLAIFGLAGALGKKKGHFITTAIEHPAVLEPFLRLEKSGHKVTYLMPNKEGLITAGQVGKALRADTALVSVMYANNEIGSIQPIAEIGRLLYKVNVERQKKGLSKIFFHTDACQAGMLDLSVKNLGVDLMTVNGGKIHGPKQSGLLYVKNGTRLLPQILGGGQERGLRSGTENVAAVAGFAKALQQVQVKRQGMCKNITSLRDYLGKLLLKKIPGLVLNGPGLDSPLRLPNNLNFTVPKVEGESLLIYLDAAGISVSTGSACSTNSSKPSHVLKAIGISEGLIRNNIRITLNKNTKRQDVEYVSQVMPELIKQIQKVRNEL
ncbi:MAG: cysteine desulfurase [Patescibacteria group bacterium]|nr:cysteine desulfurase [Patescibacteria group bacterium]